MQNGNNIEILPNSISEGEYYNDTYVLLTIKNEMSSVDYSRQWQLFKGAAFNQVPYS